MKKGNSVSSRSSARFFLVVVGILGLFALSNGIFADYTVTKSGGNVIISGADTADGFSDYTFTLTGAINPITEVKAVINTTYPKNLNAGEGTQFPTMFPSFNNGQNSTNLEVQMVPDESPLGLDYMHSISHCTYQNNSTCYNQRSYRSLMGLNHYPTIGEMPTTISLGFWLKDSMVNTVMATYGPDIWVSGDDYNRSADSTRKDNVPIKQALDSANPVPITLTATNKYQSYTGWLSKVAQQSGRTFYTFVIDNIVYKADYTPTNPNFYITFNSIPWPTRESNPIEIAGLSLLFDKKMEADYAWVNTDESDIVIEFDPNETTFAIPQYKIVGDITIYAGAYLDTILSSISGTFDINPFSPSSTVSPLTLSLNGNVLMSVSSPLGVLVENTDYTFDGTTFTFTTGFLQNLPVGEQTITFTMSHGVNPTYTIYVSNSDNYVGKIQFSLNGYDLYVKTPFDVTTNIIQRFRMPGHTATVNGPFEMLNVYSAPIENAGMSTAGGKNLANGGDDSCPFNFNGSYIGANHGMNAGRLVTTSSSHDKTYADIGSIWEDASQNQFYLLRIVSNTQLLFFSKNYGPTETQTSFKQIQGSTLTHVSSAVNTNPITILNTETIQVTPGIKHIKSELRAYRNGQKTRIYNTNNISADELEIYEYYDIVNPGLIGPTLLANRPGGGYTSNPSTAEGVPAILHFQAIHTIGEDGSLITKVNHSFVGEVNTGYYGIIQYANKVDAFGGGIWKYIPKTTSLTSPAYDFSIPFNMASLLETAYVKKTNWTNENDVPNRIMTYYKDGNNDIVAGFSAGFVPVLDGTNEELLKNLIDTSSFIYTSKKEYPYFSNKNSGIIQGVAYRHYFPITTGTLHTSTYLVPYEGEDYYYIDYHTTGQETIILPTSLSGKSPILVEKSENVSYTFTSGSLEVNVDTTTNTYSYLVLKFEKNQIPPTCRNQLSSLRQ